MQLYSTNDKSHIVNLRQAVLKGMPDDKGLYMPTEIPALPDAFFSVLSNISFTEIAYTVCEQLFAGFILNPKLQDIIEKTTTFPAPLSTLRDDLYILELFHGPSLAFKDFGAQFMAQLMSYFNRGENRKLTILVATSGDTGGAVAAGFHNTPGI